MIDFFKSLTSQGKLYFLVSLFFILATPYAIYLLKNIRDLLKEKK